MYFISFSRADADKHVVILFSTYENIDDAIDLANATTYSLTSSVWSKDVAKARDIAFQLRYGKFDIARV